MSPDLTGDHENQQPADTGATTDQDTGKTKKTAATMSKTRVGVLRGIRAGALLAIAVLVVLAMWFARHDIIATDLPVGAMALYASATFIVWAIGAAPGEDTHPRLATRRVAEPITIAVLSIAAMALCAGISKRVLTDSGVFLGSPVATGAACLGSGTLAITDLLLRAHPARRREGPHDIARWRPLPSGDTSRTASALTGLTTLVLALAVALVPTWAARPIQQLAPEPPEIPAIPTTVAGDLAWTLNLDADDDAVTITAGAAGPVVADGSEIRGLDPTDGSTRWVYSRPNATLLDLGHPWHSGTIITGPNHRYAAFAVEIPTSRTGSSVRPVARIPVTVLDTLTGQVVAERLITRESSVYDPGPIQLTDTAALIGTEAIDLATGTTLWTLPEPETAGGVNDPTAYEYVGPAGHSTFVLRNDQGSRKTDFVLVPQDDPDRRTRLGKVAADDSPLLIIDGWTIRFTGEPTDDEGAPAAAINIDEVAENGDADSVQNIDLGRATGPYFRRSRTSLVTATHRVGGDPLKTRPGTVFDPVTRTATPIERSAAVDAATFDITEDYENSAYVYRLHLAARDGSTANTIEIARERTADDQLEVVTLLAVPGAVLVHVNLPSSRSAPNRLYAIR